MPQVVRAASERGPFLSRGQGRAPRPSPNGRVRVVRHRAWLAGDQAAAQVDRIERLDPAERVEGARAQEEEQLTAALTGIREECARLIGVGKKVVIG